MTNPRFLQIHTLHSYPATLLNRDDGGLAKRMIFGDVVRTRISSQCLKWHWRGKSRRTEEGMEYEDREFALHKIEGAAQAVRSRNVVSRGVMKPLRDEGAADEKVLNAVEAVFQEKVYSGSGVQPLLLGLPEVEFLRSKAAAICAEYPEDEAAAKQAAEELFHTRRGEGNNFRAFREQTRLPGGLEAALFGRMVTSDPAANIDAAIHVAHSLTVHEEQDEMDFFTAVEELPKEAEGSGAAFMGDAELTAGLFYGYVVVDVPGLVSNLEGCPAADWQRDDTNREMAAAVVHNLIQLIATVSPGAKLGSTAPYGYADLLLVEAGNRQPRSLANAYRQPAKARLDDAIRKLTCHLQKLDACYDGKEIRRVMVTEDFEIPRAERLSLGDLAAWAGGVVRSGQAE